VRFVRIPRPPELVLQLHAAALLHHVRRLVCRGVQIGAVAERDRIPRRVRLRAQAIARARRGPADERAHVADVVVAERALDLLAVRQRLRRARQAFGCRLRGVAAPRAPRGQPPGQHRRSHGRRRRAEQRAPRGALDRARGALSDLGLTAAGDGPSRTALRCRVHLSRVLCRRWLEAEQHLQRLVAALGLAERNLFGLQRG
jgi:hypothetical protein